MYTISCYNLFTFVQTNIPIPIIDSVFLLDVVGLFHSNIIVNQFIGWIIREFSPPSLSLRAHSKISKQQQQKTKNIPRGETKHINNIIQRKRERDIYVWIFSFSNVVFIYYYLFKPLPFSHLMRSMFFFLSYLVCVCGFKSNVREKYLPFWVTIDRCWQAGIP